MHIGSAQGVRGYLAAALGSLLLLTLLATPTFGATARRTWHAAFGSGGATGSATLVINSNATGAVQIRMSGLPSVRTYSVSVYVGTCATPKVIAVLASVRTSTSGGLSRTVAVTNRAGAAIWSMAAAKAIAIRVVAGNETHCGVLTYAIATRLVIARYGIDLPVVPQQGRAFPLCNVALYLPALSQPGEAGPTFLFAHARTGMFLPLLVASRVNSGSAMVGTTIKVWTSDSTLRTYVVTRVLRHQYVLPTYDASQERLWLQTSEGPSGTPNKLVIEAKRISTIAASFATSHPRPQPIVCR